MKFALLLLLLLNEATSTSSNIETLRRLRILSRVKRRLNNMAFNSIIFIVFFLSLICDYFSVQLNQDEKEKPPQEGTSFALLYQVGLYSVVVMMLIFLVFMKSDHNFSFLAPSQAPSSQRRKLQQHMYLQAL